MPGYIDSVTGKDIDVIKSKQRGHRQRELGRASCPMVANVSLLLEFDASATR